MALVGDGQLNSQPGKNGALSATEAHLYQDLARADESLIKPVQEEQCTDLFAVAMRNYSTSDRKILPRDELVMIDVLRLAPQFVLNENTWLLHIDADSKQLSCNKPALYVPVGIRGEVPNRVHVEAGHTATNRDNKGVGRSEWVFSR